MQHNMHNTTQQGMRAELFEGAYARETEAKDEQVPVQALVQQAVDKHAATTQALQRSAKTVEETQQVAAATAAEVDAQGKKLAKLDPQLHLIDREVSYGRKILTQMRWFCCCCSLACCVNVDPAAVREHKQVMAEKKHGRSQSKDGSSEPAQPAVGQQNLSVPLPKSKLPSGGVAANLQLPEQYATEQAQLQAETSKQDALLEQIHVGILGIRAQAEHIKEAVEGQSKQAEATHAHMTKTAGTIWKVNANEFPG